MKTKSEQKPQHTPTPWSVATSIKEFVPKTQGGGLKVRLLGNGFQRLGTMNASEDTELARANAAFIVRAVNSHEELLEAAKVALERLGKLPGSAEIGTRNPGELSACDMLQRAIAKAE